MKHAYLVLTDSGGIQEEAPALGKPVLVMRRETERPEAVEAGTVKIVGTDTDNIIAETEQLLCDHAEYERMAHAVSPYGDGHAAERIVDIILRERPPHHPGGSDPAPCRPGRASPTPQYLPWRDELRRPQSPGRG